MTSLGLRPDHLGIAPKLWRLSSNPQCDVFAAAVAALSEVTRAKSPAEQLQAVERTIQSIVSCAESALRASGSVSTNRLSVYVSAFNSELGSVGRLVSVFWVCHSIGPRSSTGRRLTLSPLPPDLCSGADDLLPLFIYCLSRAQIPHVAALVACVMDWSSMRGVALGQLGYCTATLQTAAEFIVATGVDELLAGNGHSSLVTAALNQRLTTPATGRTRAESTEVEPHAAAERRPAHTMVITQRFGISPTEKLVAGTERGL